MYIPRGLQGRLIEAVAATPVVVLEGARAVGKSTMCDELVRRGHLAIRASLTDPTVRALADRDLRGWLDSLPTPAVVDEAQLIAELPLAVKDLVDGSGGSRRFVLTGSASIGRAGLGGSDPLAGRAVRLGLRPLTQLELRGEPRNGHLPSVDLPSVVDALFDAVPSAGDGASTERDEVARRMTRGGFPLRVVGAGAVRGTRLHREQVEADVTAALSEVRIGDGRFDVFRAHRLLDVVAASPGGILNVTKLAGELGMSRATVENYLGHLERRFLVHRLSNFGGRTRAQSVGTARPKVHPVDTALSIAVLNRMGQPFRTHAEHFGALLETFVVNELIAQAGWSRVRPEVGFWRDAGRRGDAEVDLVLVDGSGRTVGVEVKSSTTVHPRDAAGLLAMRASRGATRGFVVYQGGAVVELDESVWGIPLAHLSRLDGWSWPSASVTSRPIPVTPAEVVPTPRGIRPPTASVFVSFVDADDVYENGSIRRWATRLAETYEFLFGESVEVFTERDARWGERREQRIASAGERTSILLAIVTPRFLADTSCREDVLRFTAARRSGRPPLVVPVIWRRPPLEPSDDLVVERLVEAGEEDVGELRFVEPEAAPYRRRLEQLAVRLHDTISAADVVDDPTPDAPELIDRVDDVAAAVAGEWEVLAAALVRVGVSLDGITVPSDTGRTSPRAIRAWATRAVELTAPAAAGLDEAVGTMRRRWAELDDAMNGLLAWAGDLPAAQRPPALLETLDQIESLRQASDQLLGAPDIVDLAHHVREVTAASRRLRPVGRAVEAALSLVAEMRAGTVAWLGMRDRLRPA